MNLVALIDGEHYPPVVRFALDQLRKTDNILAAVFIGGTEKVDLEKGFDTYGVPVVVRDDIYEAITHAFEIYAPDQFVDLSDEPIVTAASRMKLASHILALPASYRGADFLFTPPTVAYEPKTPTLAIIGTGKRVGKTAVSAFVARTLKGHGFDPVVLAMGRGGPAEPEVIHGDQVELTVEDLLTLSEQGVHASSDNFEDALLSRVTTVGCRRCGGGLAGDTFFSNVPEGARQADALGKDIMILEGSGAAIPPVHADATIVVVGARQGAAYVTDYFGPFRLGRADLVIIANAEEPNATAQDLIELRNALKTHAPDVPVIETIFRPDPVESISEQCAFFATTAPADVLGLLTEHLELGHGAVVVGSSVHLSNRALLRKEIREVIEAREVDVLLTEIKAAAIDVVAELGKEYGIRTVFTDNVPYASDQQHFVDHLIQVANSAITRGAHL